MKTTLYAQHGEHTQWLNELSFYDDDLKIMQKRLEALASKKIPSEEVKKGIEHFQNQFIIQEASLGDIKKHIKREEKKITENILANPIGSDHRKAIDHVTERNMVQSQETITNGLRKEFNSFLSKHM